MNAVALGTPHYIVYLTGLSTFTFSLNGSARLLQNSHLQEYNLIFFMYIKIKLFI